MKDMDKYYYGKICEKHPLENGLRTKSRRVCWKCASETTIRSVQAKRKQEKASVNTSD